MDDEGFAVVATYLDEELALDAARQLVSSGLGADVVPGRYVVEEDGDPVHAFQLRVVPDDLLRACEKLEIEPPELDEEASSGTPWKAIIAIWLVAMVVIPAFAFWLTLQLAS